MDHTYAETHAVADLYLTNRLSGEEREAFEDHFVGCAACLDRLDATEDFVAGLKAARVAPSSPGMAAPASGPGRIWRVAVPALAAGILLAAAFAIFEGAGKRNAERALEAARREVASSRDALAKERDTGVALAEEMKRLAVPGEAAVFTLEATRGSAVDGPVNRIALPPAGEVVLLVDRPRGVKAALRARIAAAGGRRVGEVALHPSAHDLLALTVPAGALGPGDYVLEVLAADAGAAAGRPLAVYGFRVAPRP